MSAGRPITLEQRERARRLIATVDAKIKAGLLQIEPYIGGKWTGDKYPGTAAPRRPRREPPMR